MEDEHSCPTCGNEFETARGVRTHCARAHSTSPFSPVETQCECCDETFEYYPSNKKGRYCATCVERNEWQTPPSLSGSDNPRWNGGKRTVSCDVCGESVERHPSNIGDTVVCSESCRRAWLSTTMRGSNHPNWKGGDIGPYGPGWARTRQRALERDDYRCRLCNRSAADIGRNPDVHHIVPLRWFAESTEHTRADAHTLENVISLCSACHRQADYGYVSRETLRSLLE